jgi:uracil-DNA glycosylase
MNYSKDIDLKNLLPNDWLKYINISLLNKLTDSLHKEQLKHTTSEFYPYNQHDIFKIFNLCKLEDIKVVVLGQDPYYSNKHQANGIAFSVNQNVKIAPSLRNIFKELDIKPSHGDLTNWVKDGVFLLNASLTVTQKLPNSHQYIWKEFIQHIIDIINENCTNIIFVAWGLSAQKKYETINLNKHKLLSSSHPSPLSCYKTDTPFIGSNVFNKINENLKIQNKEEIKWKII